MRHALAALYGVYRWRVVTWKRGPAFGPHWYPLALVATAVPYAWLGGQLRVPNHIEFLRRQFVATKRQPTSNGHRHEVRPVCLQSHIHVI
jgi:hypothetical protein